MRNAQPLILACLFVTGCANACDDAGRIEGSAFPKPGAGAQAASVEMARPAADTQPVKWEAFKPLAPDTFEGYHAAGEATGREFGVAQDSELSTLTRKYTNGSSTLELEMHDAVQATGTLELFEQASQMRRETPQSVMRVVTVHDQQALAQWNAATNTARVSIMVAKRFVVNVIMKPATSPDAALALANKLDLTPLDKLGAARP